MTEEDRELLRRLERFNSVILRDLVGRLFVEAKDGRMPPHVWLALGRELSALGNACLEHAERIDPIQMDAPAPGRLEAPPSDVDEGQSGGRD